MGVTHRQTYTDGQNGRDTQTDTQAQTDRMGVTHRQTDTDGQNGCDTQTDIHRDRMGVTHRQTYTDGRHGQTVDGLTRAPLRLSIPESSGSATQQQHKHFIVDQLHSVNLRVTGTSSTEVERVISAP